MTARPLTQSDPLRQCPGAEAIEAIAPAEWAGAAGTPFSLVAAVLVAALTLALLISPAVVAVATLADATSLDPLRGWLEAAARLVQPLDYLRLGLTLTAAGLVLVRTEAA